jgi:hypothetical protein
MRQRKREARGRVGWKYLGIAIVHGDLYRPWQNQTGGVAGSEILMHWRLNFVVMED